MAETDWPDGVTHHTEGWPDKNSGPWHITAHFADVDGRRECVGIDLRSGGKGPRGRRLPLQAVTSTVFREIPIATVIESLRWWDRRSASGVLAGERGFTKNPEVKRVLAASELSRVDHYLEVAATYAEAWRQGDDPTAAVQARWPNASRSTVGRWVSTARNDHHLLEPTPPRRANGRLTKKALRLLKQKDGD